MTIYTFRYNNRRANLEALREIAEERHDRLVERLVAKRLAPGEGQTASLCVGAPSRFEFIPLPRYPSVIWPDGETPEEREDEPLLYEAVWWELEDVRVENPDDSDQYIITKRIVQARYKGPDGREHQFDNRPIFADFPAGA